MKIKYLYGAGIRGIQSFIFETGKLKEITGASELVEEICTEKYKEFTKNGNVKVIRAAAGNIRLLFSEEDGVKKIVRLFPKEVQTMAPGVTVCQAVVKCESSPTLKDFRELENRLKKQRNKTARPFTIGITAAARAPRTGRPACRIIEKEYLDKGTACKQNKSESVLES